MCLIVKKHTPPPTTKMAFDLSDLTDDIIASYVSNVKPSLDLTDDIIASYFQDKDIQGQNEDLCGTLIKIRQSPIRLNFRLSGDEEKLDESAEMRVTTYAKKVAEILKKKDRKTQETYVWALSFIGEFQNMKGVLSAGIEQTRHSLVCQIIIKIIIHECKLLESEMIQRPSTVVTQLEQEREASDDDGDSGPPTTETKEASPPAPEPTPTVPANAKLLKAGTTESIWNKLGGGNEDTDMARQK